MALIPYLNFNGNCKEAIEFYKNVFETETPFIITFKEAPKDSPFPLDDNQLDLIMHSEIKIDEDRFMLSDTLSTEQIASGNNITLLLGQKNQEKMTTRFDKLASKGTINMPLQKTFWSPLFGSVTDQFGITWQFELYE